jgi:hypothetical protein
MANLTADGPGIGMGQSGNVFHGIAGGTVYTNGLASVLAASGKLVATSTAGAGPCVGVFQHGAALDERVQIETGRIYRLTNGTAGDAFSDATILYSPVYAIDDNSVAKVSTGGRQFVGVFMGMEADGKVRVLIAPACNSAQGMSFQTGTGTLVAGVLTVNTGISVTSTSRIFMARVTEAGTDGDELRCPAADRTVGGPGTGAITIRSFLSGVAATSDTSTIEYMIVG